MYGPGVARQLVKAIRAVIDHKTYLSPGVSDIVIRDFVTGWQTTVPLRSKPRSDHHSRKRQGRGVDHPQPQPDEL